MECDDYIYTFIDEYINLYNNEMYDDIHLSMDHCTDFLPYMEENSEMSGTLHFDKSCVILLAFYFFGTPSLFHKYCVARKLFDYGYYEEAYELTTVIQNEYSNEFESFLGLLSCNPEWIECQIGIIITHELGHRLYAHDSQFKNSIRNSVLKHIDNYDKHNKSYNPLKLLYSFFYKKKLKELALDEIFIEELAADTFAFNRFSELFSEFEAQIDFTTKSLDYASISAAISGSRFFGEYLSIVKRKYFNPTNKNEFQRLYNNLKSQAKNTIIDITKTSFIESIVLGSMRQHSKNSSSKFYRQLIYPRVQKFNQSINRDVCRYLQKYMEFLKQGAINEDNEDSYNKSKQHLNTFEAAICDLINQQIIKKKLQRLSLD